MPPSSLRLNRGGCRQLLRGFGDSRNPVDEGESWCQQLSLPTGLGQKSHSEDII
ncbi:Hypothetical protein FKW44_010950 [Caligus rogercresseyi]|uniref:Uncharacterized protein n=1 Tax=Caligus rogercresseyi TaxID=217165 RepID=A0A7T8HIB9_CALRO|nr:Hypothetical protein FKW44_010950 [Caligus rogercresseyi]